MSLTPERWDRIQDLFAAALEQAPGARRAFVEAAGVDAELRRAVLGMLDGDAESDAFVDRPAADRLDAMTGADERAGRIGRWLLLERVGEGGMGVVYRARRADGAYDQEVALKLIRGLVGSPDVLRRFERERYALARLTHPNIARLIDGGTTADGEPYLVIEFVRGVAIDALCAAGPASLADRLRLFHKVCSAVSHAHRNLVVHGDLKPGNILIDDEGEPKLLDFGIARLLREDDGAADASEPESRALTPECASPEQRRGEPLSTLDDVYGLGVLLRLLAGERVPVDLEEIVAKAVHEDSEQRYVSALALSEDVARYLAKRPVRARPANLGYRARLFVGRNRIAVALGAVALVALAAGVAAVARFAGVADAERDAARTAQAKAAQERDHAAIEADSARFVAEFLMDTFLSADRLDPDEADEASAAAVRLAERVRRQFPDQHHLRANLLDAIGRVLARLERDGRARELIEEALEVRRREFGEESLEFALSLRSLGELHYRSGELEAALENLRAAYDLQQRLPRGVHTDRGAAANDLAAAHRALGHVDEARALHEEALAARRRASGPDSLPVAESLNNLGVLALTVHEDDVAERALRQALAIRSEILGDAHELTLQVLSNLASIRARRGDSAAARQLLLRAAGGLRELRSAGRRGLARVLANLATLQLHAGELSAAEDSGQEALDLQREIAGPDHPQVGRLHGLLARVWHRQNELGRAATAWAEAIRIRRATLPAGHARLIHDLRSYGEFLVEAGRLGEAEAVLLEADDGLGTAASPDALESAFVSYLLGACWHRMGRHADGARRLRGALTVLEAKLGEDAATTVAARRELAKAEAHRR